MTEEVEELMEFDLTPVEVPVKIGGADYILREATGATSIAYQNAIINSTKPGLDGQPTQITSGLSAIEPMLVSKCLFDSENKPVKQDVIKSWPSRVQKVLYRKIKEISDLDESGEQDEESKNA